MRAEASPKRAAQRYSASPARGGHCGGWRPGTNLKRAALALFLLTVAVLLVRHARDVDWSAVVGVVQAYTAPTLLLAAGMAAASHALYGCYDLIGRRQTGHRLSTRQVLATAFVSYAFNLNLGALVGGVGLRFRLYSRLGLAAATITQVLALSMLTNWLGYLVLAGAVFWAFPLALPDSWPLGSGGVRVVGTVLLMLAAAYLLMCFTTRWRVWRLRGRELTLPGGSLALLQLALSCANWMLIAGVVTVLLEGRVAYPTVLGVLLIAAIAGAMAHVPAGLGVLEAVFIALLSQRVPQAELLGALLAYRAVYYLAPLGLALVVYFTMEAQARHSAAPESRASMPHSPPAA
jgi:glycosyltransferase 2 family protein